MSGRLFNTCSKIKDEDARTKCELAANDVCKLYFDDIIYKYKTCADIVDKGISKECIFNMTKFVDDCILEQ